MLADYMIFYREDTLQHYLYNGKWVMNINPVEATRDNTWDHDPITEEPSHKHKLDQALHSKARGFAALARYQITHRGNFIKE